MEENIKVIDNFMSNYIENIIKKYYPKSFKTRFNFTSNNYSRIVKNEKLTQTQENEHKGITNS
jgi:hypothetical protein